MISKTLLRHPQFGWTLDFSAGIEPSLDPLHWETVFQDLSNQESGMRVNTGENEQVGHTWLRAPEHAPTMKLATSIGQALTDLVDWLEGVADGDLLLEGAHPVTDVVHVGVGGSTLGAQLLVKALSTESGLTVHFLDNLDAHSVDTLLRLLADRLAGTLVVVVSKSGKTVETKRLTETLFQRFRDAGHAPHAHAIAITGAGSVLAQTARAQSWLQIFPFWPWLGGRFSTLSPTALLSAGLAGAEVRDLLNGGRAMDAWTRDDSPSDNPAARLAAWWHGCGQGRAPRALIVLPYCDRLEPLGRVLQQLLMESLGKGESRQGTAIAHGLTVLGNKGSSDQHALMQQLIQGRDDGMVLFVQILDGHPSRDRDVLSMGDTLQHFLLGTRRALIEAGRPVVTLTLPCLDAARVGGLVALFERAVSMLASLLDINAYDQPGVEAGKTAARALDQLQRALQAALLGQSLTHHQLGETLDADPTEIAFLLDRLLLTGRVSCEGHGTDARYRGTP